MIQTFVLLIFCLSFTNASALERQQINLIYKHIGAGLGRDADILKEEFEALGYSVSKWPVHKSSPIQKADINVFLEEINNDYLGQADKNYLIPNAEWFRDSVTILDKFDMILCKTRECERIFTQYHPNTVYIGFTSLDRYDPKVKKNYKTALHIAGRNQQKGTDAIVDTWSFNPYLPKLYLFRYKGNSNYPSLPNMKFRNKFLKESELIRLQNQYALHLCPSETEGFGHYLMEALSSGAVVVTTNAPPMNEFVKDPRCLVGYTHTQPQYLADNYYVDRVQLDQVVANLMHLSDKEFKAIGKRNRHHYLEMKHSFQKRIKTIFKIEEH